MFSRRSGSRGRAGCVLRLRSKTFHGAAFRSRGRGGRRPTATVCRRCPTIMAGCLAGAGLPPLWGCGRACYGIVRPSDRRLAMQSRDRCDAGCLGRCISRGVPMGVGGGSLICREVCLTASLWSCGVGSTAGCAVHFTSGRDGGRNRVVDAPSIT